MTGPGAGVPGGACHAPLRRAVYQRAGAGKRPAAVVFDPGVVGDLRAWLEARVGVLARFELDPEERLFAPKIAVSAPLEVVDGAGGGSAPSESAPSEASEAPPGPPAPPPEFAAERTVQLLQRRLRLNALVGRLREARPKQRRGGQLAWQAWEDAAREAAGLPSAAWAAWRAKLGTGGARP